MYCPQGADASGYALGGFDIARSVAVEFWAVCFLGAALVRRLMPKRTMVGPASRLDQGYRGQLDDGPSPWALPLLLLMAQLGRRWRYGS